MKLENIDIEYAIYGMLFSLSNRIQTIGDKEFNDITVKQHFVLIEESFCLYRLKKWIEWERKRERQLLTL